MEPLRSRWPLLSRLSLVLGLATLAGTLAAADANPFFAMDTALRDGRNRSPAEQAALLKSIGYDGIGTSGYPDLAFLSAFEAAELKVFNTYLTLDFDAARPGLDPRLKDLVPRLRGHGTDLWIAINGVSREGVKLRPSTPAGDPIVAPPLRELADLAQAAHLRIAFYPHTGCWLERVDDALRLSRVIDRPNVGVTFNLCHWLKVEGDHDPQPILRAALPTLFYVTINGADAGDTKAMDWNRLIQPLDAGTYEVGALIQTLRTIGYHGPVGFQGYGIPGDSASILTRTARSWRRLAAPQTEGAPPAP